MPNRTHKQATAKVKAKAEGAEAQAVVEVAAAPRASSKVISAVRHLFPIVRPAAVLVVVINGG